MTKSSKKTSTRSSTSHHSGGEDNSRQRTPTRTREGAFPRTDDDEKEQPSSSSSSSSSHIDEEDLESLMDSLGRSINDPEDVGSEISLSSSKRKKKRKRKRKKKGEEEKEESKGEPDSYAKGAGGITNKDKKLKAITDDSYQKKQEDLLEKEAKGYNYGKIPTPNLGKDGCLTGYKTFLKDMSAHRVEQRKYYNVAIKPWETKGLKR